jgi:hypothetical protein
MPPMPDNEAYPPRPRLIPIPMPWLVDEKHPDVCLVTSESPDTHPTEVYVHVAMLADGPHAGQEFQPGESMAQPGPGGVINISARPPQWGPGPVVAILPIKITFRDAYAARLIPGENDMPFDVWAYQPDEPDGDFGKNLERWGQMEQRWAESDICECSGFYKVFPSSWMAELAQDEEDYHHYLLAGRYASAEVIAKGWRWERIEVVEGRDSAEADAPE